MRVTLTILMIVFGQLTVRGQSPSSTSSDILELIKLGLAEKKLPDELVNRKDTTLHPVTVAVQITRENGLKSGERLEWNKIEIWTMAMEGIFILDPYWITPTSIVASDSKISFDFLTNTFGKKSCDYYKGTIKGKKKGGQWELTKVKIEKTEYSFDLKSAVQE